MAVPSATAGRLVLLPAGLRLVVPVAIAGNLAGRVAGIAGGGTLTLRPGRTWR